MRQAPVGPLTAEVAGILRAARGRLGMSQTVLAAAADVSQSQMSKMLWGSRDITVEQLDAMCAALGIGIVDVVREAHDATDESGGAEGIA